VLAPVGAFVVILRDFQVVAAPDSGLITPDLAGDSRAGESGRAVAQLLVYSISRIRSNLGSPQWFFSSFRFVV